MCIGLFVKYPVFSSHFSETGTFLTDFQNKNSNFTKIGLVRAELFHANVQT